MYSYLFVLTYLLMQDDARSTPTQKCHLFYVNHSLLSVQNSECSKFQLEMQFWLTVDLYCIREILQ